MRLERILVPVDFSARSTGAAHYARTLATHFSSEVMLVHVLPPFTYAYGGFEAAAVDLGAVLQGRSEQARRTLAEFAAAEFPGGARTAVIEGDPAHAAVEFAHSEKADLIVLPTHGHGAFRRFILGSVAAKVLHDAECPVWTGVHLAEAPPAAEIRFRNVLCAVDLGPASRKALCWAGQFAAEYNAKVSLAHVVPALHAGQSRYFDPDWELALAGQARENLDTLQKDVGSQAEVLIESGETAPMVRAAAERVKADLLVIGRGGGNGVLGRLRANAYAIIRESPCPVVSL
jgi:nucleotide-binding universal stress UspA family protein